MMSFLGVILIKYCSMLYTQVVYMYNYIQVVLDIPVDLQVKQHKVQSRVFLGGGASLPNTHSQKNFKSYLEYLKHAVLGVILPFRLHQNESLRGPKIPNFS